ncbi:MAG: tryptophan--tRNA ligase [Clostridiales bacterium]|jgi:tryptophanyl-tRNA synthetase|nr:tryptophan--tRNA ligase [Clostridiales bacterium]
MDKKTVFSAIQPTGSIHIGNYLGAVKNWCKLQDEYNCYFAIADLHSLTTSLNSAASLLRSNIFDMYCMLLACGLNTSQCTFFCQSGVVQHSQLAWVLNCYTQYGEAKRMTQFKDKSQKNSDNVNVGLFAYPILQAADILLYNAHYVPIGIDQKQHLELSRNIAERFNQRYSPTFNVPDLLIPKVGAKIFSLTEPLQKMSKSDENLNSYILLTDDNDTIVRKIKRAVTDSGDRIEYSKDKPGLSNLLSIYCAFSECSPAKVVDIFESASYAQLKEELSALVVAHLEPIRTEYQRLKLEKTFIKRCMEEGADKACHTAKKMLDKVYKKVGLM